MFIKVKRALYSASCFYTHTHTHADYSDCTILSPARSLNSLSLFLSGTRSFRLSARMATRVAVIKTLCKTATKKKKTAKQRSEKKKRKTKRIGLGRVESDGSPHGWVGACLFLYRVVTAAACSSFPFCSSPTAAVVEGCQPLFALIALSIFAAFQALFRPLHLQPSSPTTSLLLFFSTRTWKKKHRKKVFCSPFVIVHMKCGKRKNNNNKSVKEAAEAETKAENAFPKWRFWKAMQMLAAPPAACVAVAHCAKGSLKKKRKTKMKQNKSRKCRTPTAIPPSPALTHSLSLLLNHPKRLPFSCWRCNVSKTATELPNACMQNERSSIAQKGGRGEEEEGGGGLGWQQTPARRRLGACEKQWKKKVAVKLCTVLKNEVNYLRRMQ